MQQQQDASICPERKSAPADYMLEPGILKEINIKSPGDKESLKIITENYALFREVRDQLIDLQNWERSQSE